MHFFFFEKIIRITAEDRDVRKEKWAFRAAQLFFLDARESALVFCLFVYKSIFFFLKKIKSNKDNQISQKLFFFKKIQ